MLDRLRSLLAGAALAAPILVSTSGADAAERRVLLESFTATWCVYCPPVRQAYGNLHDDHPDTFFPMGVHGSDSYTIPWGTQRNAFYGIPGYPTTWTDGTISHVGGGGTWQQHYATMQNDMNNRLAVPTDVSLQLAASEIATNTWRVVVVAGVDQGGTQKTVKLHLVQVLDHYPSGNPAYRNTIVQAASPLHQVTLVPGETHLYQHDFVLSGQSAANIDDVKFLAWAQDAGASGPQNVHNAGWIVHPFPSLDCNGNGVSDLEDLDNGTSADCNDNGVPDECDIANGTPDLNGNGVPDACDDCNGNGVPDGADLDSGASNDCNANGVPDECDVVSSSADCNENLVPDECEVVQPFVGESGELGPIGFTEQQTYRILDPQSTTEDVAIDFVAVGDFEAADEYLTVYINGVSMGPILVAAGNCTSSTSQVVVSEVLWNVLVSNSPFIDVILVPTQAVDANACGGDSWVSVTVSYLAAGSNDADENGVPDDCQGVPCPQDVDGSGAVDFGDVLGVLSSWGPCPGCAADLDASGAVDFNDLLAVLSAWGPC